MERNNEAKNRAVDTTSPACSWLAMEICVLDSKQIMNRKMRFFTKMHSIKKNEASLYVCKGSLKSHHALR